MEWLGIGIVYGLIGIMIVVPRFLNRHALNIKVTGYYPYNTKMEGGTNDRKGNPLITLQQHLSDSSTYPYASLAGDDSVFKYGQRVSIPDINANAVFRIVDTGGHFRGKNKIVDNLGDEPIDVCLDSPSDWRELDKTLPLGERVEMIIHDGDTFEA